MTRVTIYYSGIISLFLGCLFLGIGIGKLFDKTCEGTLIGIGLGLLLIALTSSRIYKKLLAFNKEKL